ncbi:recombinase family protein [Arthrobacter sp. NPDC056691]|uniref:recombinase family protein n=1 Tax=Arthrobacter sp. NPDC056691 TaxID=3345913 RepID=UPI003672CABA
MHNKEKRLGSTPEVAREYLRVSKDRDGRGKSPDQQHGENAEAAARRGWTLHADPYRDDGISASRYATQSRAGFDGLIADLDADRFGAQILVLWESSRGSRRVGEWITLIELCEERGVVIFVTTHGRDYDPSNPRDRRSLLEDAVDSEYESAKASERIRRDVRSAAENGRPHGKHLYGYRRVYDDLTRTLVRVDPEPEQARIVQEAAERVLAGETFYSIAKLFNERGLPPRRPAYREQRRNLGWTPRAIKQMLTTPAYAGKRQHLGQIVSDAVWPALIDPGVWEKRLMPLLNNPSHKRTNDWPARHLLSGIAVCGICGVKTRVGKQNVGKLRYDESGEPLPRDHYNTYICTGVPGKTGTHVAMKTDHLDLVVREHVLARVQRPDFMEGLGQKNDGLDAERQALLDEIEERRAYLEDVRVQAAARQRMDLLFDQEDRVRPLIVAAQRRFEALAATDPLVLDLAKSDDARMAWEMLELASRRRVVRALMQPRILPVGKERLGQRGINYDRVEPGWR